MHPRGFTLVLVACIFHKTLGLMLHVYNNIYYVNAVCDISCVVHTLFCSVSFVGTLCLYVDVRDCMYSCVCMVTQINVV